ncbi:TPA: hypothetical protein JIY97_00605 [Acinetobacter baumannii]|nr:hypothetical protein [Acinetobacter baumannii]
MQLVELINNIAISKQIKVEDIEKIAALGFKTIINNRPDNEEIDQDSSELLEKTARNYQIAYYHLPIQNINQVSNNIIQEFRSIIDSSNGLVVAFCKTGMRSKACVAKLLNTRLKNQIQLGENNDKTEQDLINKAMNSLIKFKEIRPNWKPALDGHPAWQIPAYKYTDGHSQNLCASIPPVVFSEEFRLTVGVVEPGRGAPLHNHTGEELMYSAGGTFVIFFDEDENNKVYLEPWDAILVPPNIIRGWRNVGKDIGCLLNISSIADKMFTK